MTEHLAAPRRRSVLTAAGAVLAVVLAGCSDPEPTLLNKSDFEGVREVENATGAPGWHWCTMVILTRLRGHATSSTRLLLPGYDAVGATLYEAGESHSAEDLLEDVRAQAAECADYAQAAAEADDTGRDSWSVEPLTDLDEGMVGWRIRDPSTNHGRGVWGEVVAIPLDDTHLLRVGFETGDAEPPVSRNELIHLALEGVERVGLDD